MVFLADMIPVELRRIVEFLNEQMDPAEVVAIEVKQFIGEGMKTLVPRVVGQKKPSETKTTGKEWDEVSFMNALREAKGETIQTMAKELLDWITPQVTSISWGRGLTEGGIVPVIQYGNTTIRICRMVSQGRFVFRFDWLCKKPPFSDKSVLQELLAKINDIPGVHFGEDVLTKPARIPFQTLTNPVALEKLKATVKWMIDLIKS